MQEKLRDISLELCSCNLPKSHCFFPRHSGIISYSASLDKYSRYSFKKKKLSTIFWLLQNVRLDRKHYWILNSFLSHMSARTFSNKPVIYFWCMAFCVTKVSLLFSWCIGFEYHSTVIKGSSIHAWSLKGLFLKENHWN